MISEAEKAVLAKHKLTETEYLAKRVSFARQQGTTWEHLLKLAPEELHVSKKMGLDIVDYYAGKLEELARQVINS